MLLDARTLRGLADGTVTHTYRRWAVVRVHAGSTMRTRVGVVEVTAVDPVPLETVDDADARGAGFRTGTTARAWIERRGEGDLYRVGLRLAGPDPRVALREDDDLDDDAVDAIRTRLARMDRAAPAPWTRDYLELIEARPAVVARTLAEGLGMERDPFKIRVRRLKELGLTESLDVGYRLSPRGRAYLGRTGRR
ncbi:ASCH domain-containing protein [Isoptericola sp. NPDC057653]|uniref:ASCH domain-containing protein n=1 Tax=Isoptericola sp. NPDC057653 TaxID=3346195 RepID=UPI0036D08285